MALSRKPFGIGHIFIESFLLRMTDTMTSQNIELSSWDTLYILNPAVGRSSLLTFFKVVNVNRGPNEIKCLVQSLLFAWAVLKYPLSVFKLYSTLSHQCQLYKCLALLSCNIIAWLSTVPKSSTLACAVTNNGDQTRHPSARHYVTCSRTKYEKNHVI
jgi:hypothetical protein